MWPQLLMMQRSKVIGGDWGERVYEVLAAAFEAVGGCAGGRGKVEADGSCSRMTVGGGLMLVNEGMDGGSGLSGRARGVVVWAAGDMGKAEEAVSGRPMVVAVGSMRLLRLVGGGVLAEWSCTSSGDWRAAGGMSAETVTVGGART